MNKTEILTYLFQHIEYFDGITDQDFYFLILSDSDTLSLMENRAYRVTPLLKQILEYSIILFVLTDDEYEIMENLFENQDEETFTDTMEFLGYCTQFMDILVDECCHHPCVENYKNIINGSNLYENLMVDVAELIKESKIFNSEDILYSFSCVDDPVQDQMDLKFGKITEIIDECRINSVYDYLKLLKSYCKDIEILFLLIDKKTSYQVNCLRDNSIYIKSGSEIDEFVNLFTFIENKTKVNNLDEEILKKVSNMNEARELYCSYRYYYIMNSYKEKVMLEKCKKL